MGLKQAIQHFIDHRVEVVRRRTAYLLEKAREREHILEGYKIALDNLDAIIKIIRGSGSRAEAKENLLAAKYKIVDKRIQDKVGGAEGRLSSRQADAILAELSQILVSRDLPLDFHPLALKAAEAARCAGDQGKYWELRDALLVNPYDLDGMAEAVRLALEMAPDERRARMGRMRLAVREHNIYRWAGLLLSELQRIPEANAGAQNNVLSPREGER